MQTIAEIMTYDVATVTPQSRMSDVVAALQGFDIGAVPVCEGKRLVGVVTDDDLRAQEAGDDPAWKTKPVSDLMQDDPVHCYSDQSADEVLRLMAAHKLMHVPVLDRDMQLQGLVSMHHMAQRVAGFPAELRKEVEDAFGSEQLLAARTHPHRSSTSSADGQF